LLEGRPRRIEQDRGRPRAAELVEGGGDRFGAHHHAGAAAIRVVVDAPVPAETPAAEVVDADRREAALADPTRDALGQGPLEHRGEEGQQVDLERHADSDAGPGPPFP
jgi:hypothetical protein